MVVVSVVVVGVGFVAGEGVVAVVGVGEGFAAGVVSLVRL